MSLVTIEDAVKAYGMVGGGSSQQDKLLLSLARQTTWTHQQRALVERLWTERGRSVSQPPHTNRATAR